MSIELSPDTITPVAIDSINTRAFSSFGRVVAKPCKSTFNPVARHDGQALAGSGALVWEGELLEFPRQKCAA